MTESMPSIQDIEYALKRWGAWLRGAGAVIPGQVHAYYDEAEETIARLRDRTTGRDELAEQVDRQLCRMKILDHTSYRVLHLYYAQELSNRNAAIRINKSEKHFKNLKESAKKMLWGLMI